MDAPTLSFTPFVAALQGAFEPALKRVSDRHWMAEVATSGGRSQVVHVHWWAQSTESRTRIGISSPVGTLPRAAPLEEFLRLNATLEDGMLCLEEYRNAEGALITHLVLRTTLPARWLAAEALPALVRGLARQADSLERTLFVTDSF
jgi:hypothetical protein